MNLYTEDGWLDIDSINYFMDEKFLDKCFIVGARGTGKSYGIQKDLIVNGEKFVYIRMSAGEIKMIANPEMNPFNAFYDDPDLKESLFTVRPIPKVENALYLYRDKDLISICLPLVTFGKYRGMDFHEYKSIFLDEFIPERTIKKTPGMGTALKQAYETVNRNRELKGEKPVRLFADDRHCGDPVSHRLAHGHSRGAAGVPLRVPVQQNGGLRGEALGQPLRAGGQAHLPGGGGLHQLPHHQGLQPGGGAAAEI